MEITTNAISGDVKITSEGQSVKPVSNEVITKAAPKEDLITRASQVKLEPKISDVPEVNVEEPHFDINDIEKIEDPAAREQATKAYKSFQRGFNQKFQEVAELRKSLEAKTQQSTKWTPERIKQELLNNPDFIQASQTVLQDQPPTETGMSETEWSSLTESEKKQWKSMQAELNSLKQKQHQEEVLKNFRSQDEVLKTKYANYDPNAVDIITGDLLAGKVQATREDLFKVYDYENAVRRAYELGKQDGNVDKQEKLNSSSFDGLGNVRVSGEKPEPTKGESDKSFFSRLVQSNIQKMKQTR